MDIRKLQKLLLVALSPNSAAEAIDLTSLNSGEWQLLMKWVQDKRLGAMLDWVMRRKQCEAEIPAAISDKLQSRRKQSMLRNLMLVGELQKVARLLDDAGIPYQALKGAYLSTHCYPEAGLRPMRDIDILVHREQIMAASALLVRAGWSLPDGSLSENALLNYNPKHLPGLISPNKRVSLELHHRLSTTNYVGGELPDLTTSPGYWERTIETEIAGQKIRFPGPTDTLLHLVRHAVIEHAFENGPLTLSDIAYLLKREQIDWPLFWENAQLIGALRPASIAFALLERLWGPQDLKWPEDLGLAPLARTSSRELELAERLLFRDRTRQRELSLISDLDQKGTILGKTGTVYRRLFPRRADMLKLYDLSPQTSRVWRHYPRHLYRIFRHRAPAFLKVRNFALHRADIADLAELNQWLTSDATEVQSPTA